jgi:DNA-binding MarR family transcriptional regulator
MSLQERVRQSSFAGAAEEAGVALLVAAGHLIRRLEDICQGQGITHDQYNVLRILRGAYPDGYPRYEIGSRLIDRSPDVTRLLDRLSRRGLVRRYRADGDRRLSLARITDRGLALIERLDEPIAAAHASFAAPLTEQAQRQLAALCGRLIPRAIDPE